jgi:hypothetical protein
VTILRAGGEGAAHLYAEDSRKEDTVEGSECVFVISSMEMGEGTVLAGCGAVGHWRAGEALVQRRHRGRGRDLVEFQERAHFFPPEWAAGISISRFV